MPENCAVGLRIDGTFGTWVGTWRPAERRVRHLPAPEGWLAGAGVWTRDGVLRLPYTTETTPCGVSDLTAPEGPARDGGSEQASEAGRPAAEAGPPVPEARPSVPEAGPPVPEAGAACRSQVLAGRNRAGPGAEAGAPTRAEPGPPCGREPGPPVRVVTRPVPLQQALWDVL